MNSPSVMFHLELRPRHGLREQQGDDAGKGAPHRQL